MAEPIGSEEFDELFRKSRVVWRLETLPTYCVEGEEEAFKAYLSGDHTFVDQEVLDWAENIRAKVSAGREWGRIHVVPAQLTDYLKFEIDTGYKITAEAGEKIGIIEGSIREVFADLEWPEQDFWLFDGKTVVLMNYDSDGRVLGATKPSDPKTLQQCLAVRERAEKMAIPLSDYMAAHASELI